MSGDRFRLRRFATLTSTSDHLIAAAEAGEPGDIAVLADVQTAGRGQHGRGWTSAPGNLHLSVLLRPGGPAAAAPQWALLAGVALIEAALAAAPAAALRLRWPNDLLLDGAKCAGVLAESSLDHDGRIAWLVLGCGVNLRHAPALPGRATACLPTSLDAPAFARLLLDTLATCCAVQERQGFAPIRTAWAAHGPAPGTPVEARGGELGRFAGLADDGSLLLDTPAGRRRIACGGDAP